MSALPQRKSPRLQTYDYSQAGAYFVTICTYRRLPLFGHIPQQGMVLNEAGQIAAACWVAIPDHYPNVELDAFVVMPNHMHGIVCIGGEAAHFQTILGRVINAYKGAVTARIRTQQSADATVWQGRYHDHVIRDENDLNRIRAYIENNPVGWAEDTFFADR